ncbi:MAG: glycerol-3-phosphate 1-O-acyltransferase PlsB, partial [Gammaproteobacteria bacterium]|nr:glycerol-3-phosphate 1-O-acyltransferase PlsB [Gammaproteobacteria bacterium]
MMPFRRFFNLPAGRLLKLFIKVRSRPEIVEALGINPEWPVIYVIDDRAWSSLLVLDQECTRLGLPSPLDPIASPYLDRWHSVYTIASRQPFKAWLKKQPKRSRMIRGIIESLRDHPEDELQFVPVSVFWGRPVAKQKNWLDMLFADAWAMGRTRKLLTILFHGRDTLLNFSKAISIKASDYSDKTNDEFIDSLQSLLSDHQKAIKTATLGPDISHRRTLVRDLLLKPSVKAAIEKRCSEDGISEYKATRQAQRYLYEIVADCTNITISVLQRLLTTFWNKFYSGIEVTNNEGLAELSHSHELVYVPCHRSHIDYLLLSYVIHREGLAIPYIAAGINLKMPVIGAILRGAGAFFIRRSFRGNELYSSVMFEYLSTLLATGMPIEYFIEGGRSRTGRLLKPMPGMLNMTVRGYLNERKKPVAFIPVYIGYEKLMESKAYQAELLGKDKKSESLLSTIIAIFKIRGSFGKVYTSFGQPIILDQLLNDCQPTWKAETYDDNKRAKWLRPCVHNLAQNIAQNINSAASVNPTNLIATALLSTPKQHIDEKTLIQTIGIYKELLRSLNYSDHILINELNGKDQIEYTESLKMLHRRSHDLGDIIYLDQKQSISMTYYRNNILHLMAIPSLIACCFLNMRTHTREEIINIISLAYPYVKAELFLIWKEHELGDVVTQMLDVMAQQNLLLKNEQLDVYTRPPSEKAAYMHLNMLARIISPVLEVYYLTVSILLRDGHKKAPREELENSCYLMAQRIAMIYELNAPDFSDRHLISNFIENLIHSDYIKSIDDEHLEYNEAFLKVDRRARLLLSREMRNNILQAIKS